MRAQLRQDFHMPFAVDAVIDFSRAVVRDKDGNTIGTVIGATPEPPESSWLLIEVDLPGVEVWL